MAHVSKPNVDKIEHPQAYYESPDELIDDQELSAEEKKMALKVWEQDARQILTASDGGMPGSEEGVSPGDHYRLGEVKRMAVILLVEDEDQVRVLTKSYLEEQGHRVLTAATCAYRKSDSAILMMKAAQHRL
jgi:hypothetical protein